MANPRKLSESKLIERFVSHNENTMGVVSNSVGMVLLQLYKRYLNEAKEEKIEQTFLTCCREIEELVKTKGNEEKLAVESMNAAILEPVNPLDKVKLWFKSPPAVEAKLESTSAQQEPTYTSEEYLFPLKQVLTLVWLAINDDSQYAHHYKEEKNETARIAAAKSHRESRLENFFRRLQEIQSGICHHGRRNGLVSLLDRSYHGVELILDNSITIMAFLKDEIREYFWDKYEDKTVSASQKKVLNVALLKWAADDNPELILKLPYSHNERLTLLDGIVPSLKNLFIKHGCHPDVVNELLSSAACSLPFSYDPKRAPYLVPVHGVLASITAAGEESRNKALLAMQKWIQEEWQPDNAAHQRRVADFYALFMADIQLKKYDLLLEVIGEKQKFAVLRDTCSTYFREDKRLLDISQDTQKSLSDLTSTINGMEKNTFYHSIENFFSRWFVARISNNLQELRKLYSILLDDTILTKIILDDKTINAFISRGTNEQKEIDVSPYEINRVFLHAILVAPEEWTPLFSRLMIRMLEFVKNTFDQGNVGVAAILKRDSYPPGLLAQLNYLHKLREGSSDNPRPRMEFLLPERIKTAEEWFYFSELLSESRAASIYQAQSVMIHKYIRDAAANLVMNYERVRFFKKVMRSIPPEKIKNLVGCFAKNAEDLIDIMLSIDSISQLNFLQMVGKDLVIRFIDNFDKLKSIVILVTDNRRRETLGWLGKNYIQKIVKKSEDFLSLLLAIPDNQWGETFGMFDKEFLKNICSGNEAKVNIYTVLHFVSPPIRLKLIKYLVDDLSCFAIKNDSQLSNILPHIPIEDQSNLIEWWFGKNLVEESKLNDQKTGERNRFYLPGYQLADVLKSIPQASRGYVAAQLKDDFFRRIIKDGSQWLDVFNAVPERWSQALFDQYYFEFLSRKEQFLEAFKTLSRNDRIALLPKLGVAVLRTIIGRCNPLETILPFIPEDSRMAFLSSLGGDYIRNICKINESDLPKILDCIPESKRVTFLSSLKSDYLSAVCTDEAGLARVIDRIPEKDLKNWLHTQRAQIFKIYTSHDRTMMDYEYVARRIHEVLLPIGKRKQLLLSLAHIYHDQRSQRGAYTSIWGTLFGYHKNAKLDGAAALINAIEGGYEIEKNGVLGSGDLGMIASAYCALSRR